MTYGMKRWRRAQYLVKNEYKKVIPTGKDEKFLHGVNDLVRIVSIVLLI